MSAAAPTTGTDTVLRVTDLVVTYRRVGGRDRFQAVSGVSLELRRGETLGIVGESGCGKSTLANAIVGFTPIDSGSVVVDDVDVARVSRRRRRELRRKVQMVFQDPVSSLNARRTIHDSVMEPLAVWKIGNRQEREAAVERALQDVGLDPVEIGRARPHELSGGECQRASLARALVLEPDLLVCDEAVSALDVSVKGQVVNLLEDLKGRHHLSVIFISHDLAVVKAISDRIVVMYLGRLCETGPAEDLYREPAHHYTRALVQSVLPADPGARGNLPQGLEGDLPSPSAPPSGCRFRTRCPAATSRCATETPELREICPGQFVACHHPLIPVTVERG